MMIRELKSYIGTGVRVQKGEQQTFLNGVHYSNGHLMYSFSGGDMKLPDAIVGEPNIKLMLRPMSQLAAVIKAKNKSFVPLVELKNLAKLEKSLSDDFKEYEPISKITYGTLIGNGYYVSWDLKTRETTQHDDGVDTFTLFYKSGSFWCEKNGENIVVLNQHDLMGFLFEWQFDVFDLIGKDYAVPLK